MTGLGRVEVLSETGVRLGGALYTSGSGSSGMAAAELGGRRGRGEDGGAPHSAGGGGRRGQGAWLCACSLEARCMLGVVVRPRPSCYGGQARAGFMFSGMEM